MFLGFVRLGSKQFSRFVILFSVQFFFVVVFMFQVLDSVGVIQRRKIGLGGGGLRRKFQFFVFSQVFLFRLRDYVIFGGYGRWCVGLDISNLVLILIFFDVVRQFFLFWGVGYGIGWEVVVIQFNSYGQLGQRRGQGLFISGRFQLGKWKCGFFFFVLELIVFRIFCIVQFSGNRFCFVGFFLFRSSGFWGLENSF